MPLTLSVTDLAATPTGATAAVAGTGGAAVAVRVAPVTGEIGPASWVSAGARTGDGAVSLTLAKGYYWAVAVAGVDLSPLVYFQVTDGLDSVQTRCRAAIAATLQLLALPCTAGGRVAGRWSPRDRLNLPERPCTVLSTEDESDDATYFGNVLDGYDRPTLVRVVGRDDPQDAAAAPQYELWRQAMMRAFHHQRLAGVPEVRYCEARARPVLEEDGDEFEGVASAFVVVAHTREPRGLGA